MPLYRLLDTVLDKALGWIALRHRVLADSTHCPLLADWVVYRVLYPLACVA